MTKIKNMIISVFKKAESKVVSDIDKLEIEVERMRKVLKRIKESRALAKGKEVFYSDKIEEAQKLLDGIVRASKILMEKEDDIKLAALNVKYTKLESDIKSFENALELSKNIFEKLSTQIISIENEVLKAETAISSAKMKAEFTKDFNDFNDVVGFDGGGVKEILESIQVKFNASEFSFDEKVNEVNVDTILVDSSLDSFKEKMRNM